MPYKQQPPRPIREVTFKFYRPAIVPPELMQAVLTGEVTDTEFKMVCLIDVYSGNSERGCFATNRYLAEQLACRPDHVSYMVGRLVKAGYLISATTKVSRGEQRHLWTAWTKWKRDIQPLPVEEDSEADPYPPRDGIPTPPRDGIPTPSLLIGIEDEACCDSRSSTDKSTPSISGQQNVAKAKRRLRSEQKDIKEQLKELPQTPDGVASGNLYRAFMTIPRHMNGVDVNLANWPRQIAAIREGLAKRGERSSKVELIIDWLQKHAADKFTPKVKCAERFKEEFHRFEAAYVRDVGEPADEEPAVKPEAMSDEERRIFDHLVRVDWPISGQDSLAKAIPASLKAIKEFYADLRKVKDNNGPLEAVARRLFVEWGFSPSEMVRDWFEDRHECRSRRGSWDGIVKPIDVRGKQFSVKGSAIAQEYGNGRYWWRLMELMGYYDPKRS